VTGVPDARAAADQPTRILLVGDSITEGSVGDWTWRYRLWHHLQATGSAVDFVGPHDGVFDRTTGVHGSPEYADPLFDRDHAAMWGATFASQSTGIQQLITDYQPQVVVAMLGINDLAKAPDAVDELAASVAQFVSQVRSADPGVDIVIPALPQVWLPGVTQFNAQVPGIAQALDTPDSRVVAANPGDLTELVDTYDRVHPSATGELKVAAEVADSLAFLNIGTQYPRPLPQVANGPRKTAALSAQAGDGRAVLSWLRPPGATEEFVWLRDVSASQPWRRLPVAVRATTYEIGSLIDYHVYDVRLQSAKGTAIAEDLFSNTVRLTPKPPAVTGVVVTNRNHRVRIRWSPAAVSSYQVQWWPRGRQDLKKGRTVAGTGTVLRKLDAGRRYVVTIAAVSGAFLGPRARVTAVPRGPSVRAPARLRATPTGRRTCRLTWRRSARATRYEVWLKGQSGNWRTVGWSQDTRFTSGILRGSAVPMFRVRAWHDRVAGGRSPVVACR
jgi:hypothetical protein